MDGYLSLNWHGAHEGGEGKDRDIYSVVHIAKDSEADNMMYMVCEEKNSEIASAA